MNVRLCATQVIAQLLRQEGSLSSVLPNYLNQVSTQDRGLLQEICYGTCRWQPRLSAYLEMLLEKPLRKKDLDVYALLLIGLYQLTEMRVPEHAAVSETVNATQALKKPWAKGVVNGVLRRFLREKSQLENKLALNAIFNSAHPLWLHNEIVQSWPHLAGEIFAANNSHPPFTLRVNQTHVQREDYLRALSELNMAARTTTFSDSGITLEQPCDVAQLPGFFDGDCSVQDEAAQLAANLLQLEPGQRVLDACCAPGGKTAHLLEAEPSIQCVAIDISAERIKRTSDNLKRLRLEAELKVADAAEPNQWWDGQWFDRILLDAPCSATGVIRRHPDIKILREADNVAKLVATQQQLLHALWPLLKDGGLLLYATCSILPSENCSTIADFVGSCDDVEHKNIAANWGIKQAFGRQVLPQSGGPDGFFYALLQKRAT